MASFALQRPARKWARQHLTGTYQITRFVSRKHGIISSHEPVDLSYTSFIPDDGNETEKPLVILHGLFGSRRNWGSLCKALHRDILNVRYMRSIYEIMGPMASDVHKFLEDKKLKDVALLGHSMGGKVAMTYALAAKELSVSSDILSQLIVVDIAPSIGSISSEFISYVSAMQTIEALPPGVIKTRADADNRLKAYEPDLSVRQFLLTNLKLPTHLRTASHHNEAHDKARFIVPLGILSQSIEALGSFPYEYNHLRDIAATTWDGPTLVLKGSRSAYINHKNTPAFHAFFPNMQLKDLDAGHWVHAEKPTEFRKLVVEFFSTA